MSLTLKFKHLLKIILITYSPIDLIAQENPFHNVQPIKNHVLASPNQGWSKIPDSERSLSSRILTWIPDRLLDFWDIFKLDLGLGPSVGGTIRVSRYLQGSYRHFAPGSFRVGALGRRSPFMIETSDEQGISPFSYQTSKQRDICTYELGLGLEFLVAGGYFGVCPEEMLDFAGGLILLDFEHDDY